MNIPKQCPDCRVQFEDMGDVLRTSSTDTHHVFVCQFCGATIMTRHEGANMPKNCPKCNADNSKLTYDYPDNYRCQACGHTWRQAPGDKPPTPVARELAHDPVNYPQHYNWLPKGIEVIDITELFDFNRGNALKYLMRAGRKGGADELEDLQKARWYLDRAICNLEAERAPAPS